MKKLLFALIVSLSLLQSANVSAQISDKKYETRAAWLTTIYGLDWPSSTLPSSQKRELSRILDHLGDLGINTIFLQVRGRGDLIYPSKIEPVNPYFSEDGTLSYDPLKYAIDECRKRGMSIHAWVVAIPVGNRTNMRKLGNKHFAARHPGSVLMYNGTYYMDPSDRRTTEHLQAITKELLDNYDLDGIHLDYIRYPEHSLNKIDRKKYARTETPLSYEGWRRDNITRVVKGIHETVHATDTLAELSAAVIGTYKSRVPGYDGEVGWNAYEAVQQDPVQWAKEGAIDFVVPMLYRRGSSFWPIIKQWKSVMDSIPVLVGVGAYRVLANEGDWPDREILDQTTLVQADSSLMGVCYFRAEQIEKPSTVRYRRLRDENFKKDALPLRPRSGVIDSVSMDAAPHIISLVRESEGLRVKWETASETPQDIFAVYASGLAEDIDLSAGKNLAATTKDYEILIPWSAFGIEVIEDSEDYLLSVNVTTYNLHSGVETVLGNGQIYLIRATEMTPSDNAEAQEMRTGLPVPVAEQER